MNTTTRLFTCITLVILVQSCTTQKNTIFWVNGIKTECTSGVGKTQCLNIHKGENFDNPKWENFYATIEGFEFEEGYLKKIEVKKEKLKHPPADASSFKYTLVKELDKQIDSRLVVNGKWLLNRIDNHPVNKKVKLPELEIQLNKMQISGHSGCNNYTGQIKKITASSIQFGEIVSTKKACLGENLEQEYYNNLNKVNTFQVTGDNLIFLDKEGNKRLSFLKKNRKRCQFKVA